MERFWGVVPDTWPSEVNRMIRCKSLDDARKEAEKLASVGNRSYVIVEAIAYAKSAGVQWVNLREGGAMRIPTPATSLMSDELDLPLRENSEF